MEVVYLLHGRANNLVFNMATSVAVMRASAVVDLSLKFLLLHGTQVDDR